MVAYCSEGEECDKRARKVLRTPSKKECAQKQYGVTIPQQKAVRLVPKGTSKVLRKVFSLNLTKNAIIAE